MAKETVYDSRQIADYFVKKAGPQGLTPLQVIKLTYIAHGFTLGLHDRPLLEDDVEAWQYGPVVRKVYNCLPGGSSAIRGTIYNSPDEVEPDDAATLDEVFANYGNLSGTYLSNLTHRPGSPWAKTWEAYGKNAVIPQSLIERHYKAVLENFAKAQATGASYSPEAL